MMQSILGASYQARRQRQNQKSRELSPVYDVPSVVRADHFRDNEARGDSQFRVEAKRASEQVWARSPGLGHKDRTMYFNLIVAVVWLLVGTLLILQPVLQPGVPQWTIQGTGLSIGWVAIVFAMYNLVRWSLLVYAAWRRAQDVAAAREQALHRPPPPGREPDPNFIFTDPSSDSGNEGPGS
jgi:hypothetical protein